MSGGLRICISLALAGFLGAGAAPASGVDESPAALDLAVRQALKGVEVQWTDAVHVPSAEGPVLLSYVRASDWEGLVRLAWYEGAWRLSWQTRRPAAADQTTFLQVTSGWELVDLDGDGLREALFSACYPHNCCGEFGLGVVEIDEAAGSLLHVIGESADVVEGRLEGPQGPRKELRAALAERLYQQLCPTMQSDKARRSLAMWLDSLP